MKRLRIILLAIGLIFLFGLFSESKASVSWYNSGLIRTDIPQGYDFIRYSEPCGSKKHDTWACRMYWFPELNDPTRKTRCLRTYG